MKKANEMISVTNQDESVPPVTGYFSKGVIWRAIIRRVLRLIKNNDLVKIHDEDKLVTFKIMRIDESNTVLVWLLMESKLDDVRDNNILKVWLQFTNVGDNLLSDEDILSRIRFIEQEAMVLPAGSRPARIEFYDREDFFEQSKRIQFKEK